MSDNDYVQGTMDTQEQKDTFRDVMTFSAKMGIPFSMGVGAFFTALLVNSGLIGGAVVFLLVFLLSRWVLMTFFAH